MDRAQRIALVIVILAIASLVIASLVGWEIYQGKQIGKVSTTDPKVTEQVVEKAADKVAQNSEVKEKVVVKTTEKLHKDPEVRKQVVTETTMLLVTDPEVKTEATKETAQVLKTDGEFRNQAAKETAKECCPNQNGQAPQVVTPTTQSAAPAVSQPVADNTRVPNPPTPPRIVDGEVLLTPMCGGGMGPQLLPDCVVVSYDGALVRITGITPVDVEVYSNGTRHLGSVKEFRAEIGTRFNFTFRCKNGHVHYALITSEMAAFLPDFFGREIGLDCSGCCGCVFIVN